MMDWSLVLTAGGTIITIVGSNIALIGWVRSDMKSFETKIETKIDSFQKDIRDEMKDFHGRLCSLEARYHDEKYKKTDKNHE